MSFNLLFTVCRPLQTHTWIHTESLHVCISGCVFDNNRTNILSGAHNQVLFQLFLSSLFEIMEHCVILGLFTENPYIYEANEDLLKKVHLKLWVACKFFKMKFLAISKSAYLSHEKTSHVCYSCWTSRKWN